AVLAYQNMQLEQALLMGRRGYGKRRQFAVRSLQQQVLSGVIAQRFARRRSQQQAADVAAHVLNLDQLAGKTADRKLVRRQHALPFHLAVFQRLGNAGVEFAAGTLGAVLRNPTADQVGGTDMAVAVATALRRVKAQAADRIDDALARQQFDDMPGGLQGNLHQSIPSS